MKTNLVIVSGKIGLIVKPEKGKVVSFNDIPVKRLDTGIISHYNPENVGYVEVPIKTFKEPIRKPFYSASTLIDIEE